MKQGQAFPFGVRRMGVLALIIALLALSVVSLSAPGVSASSRSLQASIGGCRLFPANNIWNDDISQMPVAANSANYLATIGLSGHLHPDFGSSPDNGFPYTVVSTSQPSVPVRFRYANESDPGPYPIPVHAPIEDGSQSTGDRHVLVVQSGTCKLYELFAGYPQNNGSWQAGSGAVWNLNSNALRPATWTSADAAGLPILPGLISYDEVASGAINHALRVTVAQTQDAFIWPARHAASSSHNPNLPPMGLRLRLKARVNLSSFSRVNQIILTALKHYGMFVADNGTSWHLSGIPDSRWSDDELHALTSIPGSDFEAIDESSLEMNANSGQVRDVPVSSAVPSPTATLVPHVANTPQTEIGRVFPVASSRRNTSSGSLLWPVLGGMALLLGIIGAMLLLRQKKRMRTR